MVNNLATLRNGAWLLTLRTGMARVSIAAAFIQAKMPLGAGGTLTDQEVFDIAAYISSQPRPAFSKAASDWRHGDAPSDATTGRPMAAQ